MDQGRQDGGSGTLPVHDLPAGAALVRDGVAALAEGAALVREARGWAVSDAELCAVVEDLTHAAATLEAARLAAIKALDDRPGAVDAVAPAGRCGVGRSTVAVRFLMHRLHVDPGQARRDVEAAHALDRDDGLLPLLGAALAQGEVSRAHVDACVRVARDLPPDLATCREPDSGRSGLQVADAFLTDQARDTPPRTTRWLADQLLARLCPDRGERADRDAHLRRSWRQYVDGLGLTRVAIAVPPADAAHLAVLVAKVGAPAPVGTAVDGEGQQILVADLRSREQRVYDGMMAVIRAGATAAGATAARGKAARATAAGATGTGAPSGPVTVLVTATPDQVAGASASLTGDPQAPAGLARVDHVGPVTATTLARLSCGNTLQKVLLAPSGAVLDLGRSVRLATPAQRKALAARDGGCVIPGCPSPVSGCDIHHLTGWAVGGATDIAGLVPLCPRHHTETHHGHWLITMYAGVPWVRPPAWIDPYRQPQRNITHHSAAHAQRIGEQLHLMLEDDP